MLALRDCSSTLALSGYARGTRRTVDRILRGGGPPCASIEEKERGSFEVGKVADIMEIPETEILKVRRVMTVIGGEIVHSAQ